MERFHGDDTSCTQIHPEHIQVGGDVMLIGHGAPPVRVSERESEHSDSCIRGNADKALPLERLSLEQLL
ncbi:MAG: hypothetical protein ABI643_00465 [Candidatus Doudnabacteria bacterium]